jgi:hypothetical protein
MLAVRRCYLLENGAFHILRRRVCGTCTLTFFVQTQVNIYSLSQTSYITCCCADYGFDATFARFGNCPTDYLPQQRTNVMNARKSRSVDKFNKKIFSMGYISIDVELAWGVVGVSEGGGVPSKGIGDTCHG